MPVVGFFDIETVQQVQWIRQGRVRIEPHLAPVRGHAFRLAQCSLPVKLESARLVQEMRTPELLGQELALDPVDSVAHGGVELIPLLTDGALHLALGRTGKNGIGFKSMVADRHADGKQTADVYVVGILLESEDVQLVAHLVGGLSR